MTKRSLRNQIINIDKFRVAANITECILFHVINVCKNVKNRHIQNELTVFLVTIIELLHFIYST